VYPSAEKAEEVSQRLLKLQKEYLITINDAVIAVKTRSRRGQTEPACQHDSYGSGLRKFLGTGVLFLNPIIGVALGRSAARYPILVSMITS
jgi:uncharacterized membrane protein